MYLCVGVYTYADACRIQKRASNPAELGFQEAVSCVMWLLETDLRSPALNSQAISLVPFSNLFFRVCVYNPALDHSQFLPCCLLLYGLTVQVPESPNWLDWFPHLWPQAALVLLSGLYLTLPHGAQGETLSPCGVCFDQPQVHCLLIFPEFYSAS